MAIYDVEIPGKGTFRVEAKGELTEVQAYRAAKVEADQFDDRTGKRMDDPTSGMSALERGAAGAGKAVTDLWQGLKQAAGFAGDKEVAEKRALDAPLMNTTGGKVGNFAGNATAALPTLLVPGANTYKGAALVGGLMGMLQPTMGNESRVVNTALGAGFGTVGQGAGNLIGRAIRPVQTPVTPQHTALVAEAQARNIPITAGQATGSRPLQITESVMENLPFTSGPQLALKQQQQTAYNRAVGSTFGSAEDAITPQVAGTARQRIGQQFTDLASRNTLQADNALMTQLANIDEQARRYLTPDVGRVVLNRLDDVLARIENGTMTGTAYRNLDSELGRAARGTSNGDLKHALGDLRGALREAMDRSISEADQTAWQGARREYANLMTVAPLAARSETGNVSGRTLLNAATTANQGARFGAPSELATLGRIGRAFVAEQIPNSGTAQRQLIQSLLTGGGGAGIGAVGAAATGNDPLQGAAIGAGVTAGGLLAPRVAQSLMNTPAGQAYLTRGLIPLTPQQLAAINAAARGGAFGLIGSSK